MFKGYRELRKETACSLSSLPPASFSCRHQKFSTCRRTKGPYWFQRLQLVWRESSVGGMIAGERSLWSRGTGLGQRRRMRGACGGGDRRRPSLLEGDRDRELSGIRMKNREGEMLWLLCVRKGNRTCREPIGMGGKNMRKQELNTHTCSWAIAVRLSWMKGREKEMQMLSSSSTDDGEETKDMAYLFHTSVGGEQGDARSTCLAGGL